MRDHLPCVLEKQKHMRESLPVGRVAKWKLENIKFKLVKAGNWRHQDMGKKKRKEIYWKVS